MCECCTLTPHFSPRTADRTTGAENLNSIFSENKHTKDLVYIYNTNNCGLLAKLRSMSFNHKQSNSENEMTKKFF